VYSIGLQLATRKNQCGAINLSYTYVMRDTAAFGERFTQALAKAGYADFSTRKLGERLGVSPTAAVTWKKGEKIPGVERMVLIADHLGVDVGWLLTGRGAMAQDPSIKIFTTIVERMTPEQRKEVFDYAAYIIERGTDKAKELESLLGT